MHARKDALLVLFLRLKNTQAPNPDWRSCAHLEGKKYLRQQLLVSNDDHDNRADRCRSLLGVIQGPRLVLVAGGNQRGRA